MKEVAFPTMFGVTPPADDTAPYAASYTIVDNTNTDGSYDINSMDNVDNIDSGAPISVTKDFTDPNVSLTVEEAGGYDFDLTWNSTDGLSGPSGVYDVEYRDGETGNWQLWQNDITETGMQFTAIPGHNVYFRVLSKDRVDNVGVTVSVSYTVELETKKYYYFGGQRAAMRVVTASTNQVYYLHGDHLGSVSLTTDTSGAVVSQARYMPYGEVRWDSSASPTDYAFTGQRAERGFGLLDFNARYFSPRLGRFISADSLVPNPYKPADFDRYQYVRGNPLRFIDPSGHLLCSEIPWEEDCTNTQSEIDYTLAKRNIDELNYWGKKMLQLYSDLLKSPDGWWNEDGDFTLEEFFAMSLMFEFTDLPPTVDDILISVVSSKYWCQPNMGASQCSGVSDTRVAILNYVGSRGSMRMRYEKYYLQSGYTLNDLFHQYNYGRMNNIVSNVLYPSDQSIKTAGIQDNVEWTFGNLSMFPADKKEEKRLIVNIDKRNFGYEYNTVVFRWGRDIDKAFVVFTYDQYRYWMHDEVP